MEEAVSELVDVINTTRPSNFTPKVTERGANYVRAEYESPTFGEASVFWTAHSFWRRRSSRGSGRWGWGGIIYLDDLFQQQNYIDSVNDNACIAFVVIVFYPIFASRIH